MPTSMRFFPNNDDLDQGSEEGPFQDMAWGNCRCHQTLFTQIGSNNT